jgi:hypothetical protein
MYYNYGYYCIYPQYPQYPQYTQTLIMETRKTFCILTEETPNIDEIRIMLALVGCFIPSTVNNKNIVPIISLSSLGRQTWAGEWSLTMPDFTISIKLFKGRTASVDYMLFDGDCNLDTGNAGKALCVLESTKTSDASSRNTAVFQRITKFTAYDKMYPQSSAKKVMFWCNSVWKDKLTDTARFGLRLMDALNIRLFSNYNGCLTDIKEKYKIQPFETSDELIQCKNSIVQKKGNVSIRMWRENSHIHISLKLDKGNGKQSGVISHDPNVGFLAGVINCFEKINPEKQNKYIIENHRIEQKYFDKCPSSKLWHSIHKIDVAFKDRIIKRLPELPSKYFTIEDKMTEKLATILCDMTSKNRTIFSNHGGCALTYIIGPDSEESSVGRKMPRPDIVFENREKKEILIIEGKVESDLSKGIHQLSKNHLEGFVEKLKNLYPGHSISKGLCITISDILVIGKYDTLEYPIKFALDNNGCFIDLR